MYKCSHEEEAYVRRYLVVHTFVASVYVACFIFETYFAYFNVSVRYFGVRV